MDSQLVAHEDFVGMVELGETTAEAITETIKDCLLRYNLPLSDCRGQCYDGASVMVGVKSGVATLLSKVDEPCIMVWTSSHRGINMCLQYYMAMRSHTGQDTFSLEMVTIKCSWTSN